MFTGNPFLWNECTFVLLDFIPKIDSTTLWTPGEEVGYVQPHWPEVIIKIDHHRSEKNRVNL